MEILIAQIFDLKKGKSRLNLDFQITQTNPIVTL
jgi:hypothetical protein